MVSLEEVRKKASNAKQKQALAAVRVAPTAMAANPPLRLRDFLRTPCHEMSRERETLAMHRDELGRESIAKMVKVVGIEKDITLITQGV